MKQGALIFDERTDRYDIRFDLADYYGGLHCGQCFDPRHPPDAGSGSGNHGKFHDPDDVTQTRRTTKTPGRKAKLPARCFLSLSRHFAVWVKLPFPAQVLPF